MSTPVKISFPIKGLFEGSAYDDLPELTTPDSLNARARDPLTGRYRGSQRAGSTKFNTNAARILGDTTDRPIQFGISVVKHDDRVTYTARTGADPASVVSWQRALPSLRDGIAIAVDRQSNLFVVAAQASGGTGINFLAKYNSSGTRIWVYPIPLASNTHIVKSVKLDNVGGVYVTIAGSGTAGKVIKFQETTEENGNLRFVWEIPAPNNGLIVDVAVSGNYLYFLENYSPSAGNNNGVLHRWDDAATANPRPIWNGIIAQWTDAAGNEVVPICLGIACDGGAIVGLVDETDPSNAQGELRKFGPHAPTGGPPVTPVWTYSGNDGVGQAVKCDTTGNVYTCGYGTVTFVRKLLDSGASVASTRTWTSAVTGLSFSEFKGAQLLDVDRQGNVYYAQYRSAGTATENAQVFFRLTSNADTADIRVTTGAGGIAAEGYGVVVDPFDTDQASKAEYAYLVTSPVASTSYAVHRLSLLAVTSAEGSPRSLVQLAVINGTVRTFSSGAGAGSTPSGGSGALSTSTKWICGAQAFNRTLLTDGLAYKQYNHLTAVVSDWAATAGQIPRRGRLLCIWADSAFVAGFEDNPHQWAKSAGGDLDDFDFFPPVPFPGQAVLGTNSDAGLCPDIVTCVIPWSDDLLVTGGDHSIHRLTGDPSDGGRWDRITDITGIAWGQGAWCKDPAGNVYFLGAQGGFFRMSPGSVPDEITVVALSQRLANVNLSTHKVQLVWNDAEKGVHVFLTPFTNTTQTTHYFWDAVNEAWWPDQFAYVSGGAYLHNPFAVWVADGDAPGDRKILLGQQDGYVRYLDSAAKDDDGTAIDSYCYIRVPAGDGDREIKVVDTRVVMGAGVEDATLSAYGLESADFNLVTPGSPDWSATVSAGRNNAVKERVRGQVVYFRIRNATIARRWALDSLRVRVAAGGRVRNR